MRHRARSDDLIAAMGEMGFADRSRHDSSIKWPAPARLRGDQSKERSPVAPMGTTIRDERLSGFDAIAWERIMARPNTRRHRQQAHAEIVAALKGFRETRALLEKQAMQTVGNCGGLRRFIIEGYSPVWKEGRAGQG